MLCMRAFCHGYATGSSFSSPAFAVDGPHSIVASCQKQLQTGSRPSPHPSPATAHMPQTGLLFSFAGIHTLNVIQTRVWESGWGWLGNVFKTKFKRHQSLLEVSLGSERKRLPCTVKSMEKAQLYFQPEWCTPRKVGAKPRMGVGVALGFYSDPVVAVSFPHWLGSHLTVFFFFFP